MKTVGDAFKMYKTIFLETAAKAQQSAISPCKAQPKFGTRFDNLKISVKIGENWIY